jgi:hypothetical protein
VISGAFVASISRRHWRHFVMTWLSSSMGTKEQ